MTTGAATSPHVLHVTGREGPLRDGGDPRTAWDYLTVVVVKGHRDLPGGGQQTCPLVAT